MARRKPDTCSECGTEFRAGRLACPECGSDASTGWKNEEDIQYESIEIPQGWGEQEEEKSKPGHLFLIAAILALLGMAIFAFVR